MWAVDTTELLLAVSTAPFDSYFEIPFPLANGDVKTSGTKTLVACETKAILCDANEMGMIFPADSY
jgi:hypothetical protein